MPGMSVVKSTIRRISRRIFHSCVVSGASHETIFLPIVLCASGDSRLHGRDGCRKQRADNHYGCSMPLAMQAADLYSFLEREFPQVGHMKLEIAELDERSIRLRLPVSEQHLRPGGTISGPTLMWLADLGMYLLVLSQIGPV